MNNTVNPQVVDSIAEVQKATFSADVLKLQGEGKSFQAVAQSMSISVQDSSDILRNISMIATTGIGVAAAKLVETKDPQYAEIITNFQDAIKKAADNAKTIGINCGEVLKSYPNGG